MAQAQVVKWKLGAQAMVDAAFLAKNRDDDSDQSNASDAVNDETNSPNGLLAVQDYCNAEGEDEEEEAGT